MAWKTLGTALENALASALNVGEEGVDAPSVSRPKRTGTEAPAKSREEIVQPQRRPETKTAPRTTQPAKAASLGNAKGRRTHPHELAPLGVRQPLMLRVIEGGLGGGPAGSGGEGRAAYAQAAGGGRTATSNLRIVV